MTKKLANYVQGTSESPWLISLCFPRSNPSALASAIKLLSFTAFPSTPVTDPYVPPRRRTPRPTRSCRRIAAHPDRPLPSAHRPLFGPLDPASPAYAHVTFVPMRSQSVPPESVSDSRPVSSSEHRSPWTPSFWLGSACSLCPWKPGWLRLQVRRPRRCCHLTLRIRRRGSPNRARYRRKGLEILTVGVIQVSSC